MSTFIVGSSLLADVWKSIGTELAIFVVTLGFALAIRTFNFDKKLDGKMKSAAACDSTAVSAPKLPAAAMKDIAGPKSPVAAAATSQAGSPGGAQRRAGGVRRTPATVLDEIVNIMRDQPSLRFASRALQLYQEELRPSLRPAQRGEGVRLQEIARFCKNSPVDLYTTLVHCAVRAGRYHLVEGLMDDMVKLCVQRPLSFYESAMKQLAGQKQYHLALAVHDRLAADGLRPSTVTCSCLIGFAAEVGELQRAIEFFERLAAASTPSIRAYMTVLRVHAKRQDFAASVEILRDMERRSVGLDSLALNVALATGVAANNFEGVTELLADADARRPPISDVVSYNTLVKGYAQRGSAAGAAKAIDQMKARGLKPNAITFNTAMDAAVRSGEVAGSWKLLADMRRAGLPPDKFTCSILVKGLLKGPSAQQVQDALVLLREVDSSCDQTLKSTLYHAVLDAATRANGSQAGAALQAQAFAQMRLHKVQPSPTAQRLMVKALPSMGSEH